MRMIDRAMIVTVLVGLGLSWVGVVSFVLNVYSRNPVAGPVLLVVIGIVVMIVPVIIGCSPWFQGMIKREKVRTLRT